MPDRDMAAQQAMLRRRIRPMWSVPEQRIVDLHARRLVQGRYSTPQAAAEACKPELDRLHARRPSEPWAATPRRLKAVAARIEQHLKRLGITWPGADFLPCEQQTLDRFAREYMKGRHQHLNQAARACWQELKRQSDVTRRRKLGLTGTAAPRKLKAVASQLEMRTRKLGRPRLSHPWSRAEWRVVDKWVRRYVVGRERGTGPSEEEALKAMARELEERGYPRRPADGYRGGFEKRQRHHPRARVGPGRHWQGAELTAAQRWARVCLAARRDGVVFCITEAARGLQAELARQGFNRTARGCEGIVERIVRPRKRR